MVVAPLFPVTKRFAGISWNLQFCYMIKEVFKRLSRKSGISIFILYSFNLHGFQNVLLSFWCDFRVINIKWSRDEY